MASQQQHTSNLQLGHSRGEGLSLQSAGKQPQSAQFIVITILPNDLLNAARALFPDKGYCFLAHFGRHIFGLHPVFLASMGEAILKNFCFGVTSRHIITICCPHFSTI
jgi:hypothetical protein